MTSAEPDATEGQDGEGVDDIVDELALGEKRLLLRGRTDPDGIATGYLPPIDRLSIPSFSMVDGPMGVRAVTATAFPSTLSLASTWDPDLAREYGRVLASEARGAGQDALLAPGVNLIRVPYCGRNFEYYSEDPTLTSRLSTGTIEGIQDGGVMATVKHYACNNQEADRHHVSAEVGERALRELYLPAFEAAVTEADVASVMAAYNRIDGTYATEHRRLLRDVLREEWDFDGFVVSDWWATFDGPAAAEAGLDLDMPGVPLYDWQEHGSRLIAAAGALPDADWFPKSRLAKLASEPWQPANPNPNVLEESPFGRELTAAIEEGRIDESLLDEKVRNLLRQYERFGLLDGRQPSGEIDAPEHRELAQRIAERGTVLLKNEGAAVRRTDASATDDDGEPAGVLPLDLDDVEEIALVGPHVEEAKTGGGGSSEVDAARTISPAAGLRARVGNDATVQTVKGADRVPVEFPIDGPFTDLSLPSVGSRSIDDAVEAALHADVAVVVVRDDAQEGEDRTLGLPGDQDELIERVAAAAERSVVVCNTAGAVAMPWLDAVDALVEAWYPGQEDGAALARVLCGDVDPAGRLPVTIGASRADYPTTTEAQYPGVDLRAEYSEGVFVGYRHFDADDDAEVLFPFGHGLSYAAFEYGDLAVDRDDELAATASVTVENVAERDGREVVQAYVAPPESDVERPPQELAAFEAVALEAGEARSVDLSIEPRDLAYYDEDAAAWVVEPGEYELRVGRSSRDHRATATIEVGEDAGGSLQ